MNTQCFSAHLPLGREAPVYMERLSGWTSVLQMFSTFFVGPARFGTRINPPFFC